jgi:maltooligosyltrehalose trehalohydrolase
VTPDLQPVRLGAVYLGDQECSFLVWAPKARKVELFVVAPAKRTLLLQPVERGYHAGRVEGLEPGAQYFYRLDGRQQRPDPASRFQPEGIHGPSEILDNGFEWHDQSWSGLGLREYIIYELHVGTFTSEGTFAAVIPHLRQLKELGITALELMPVAQFPGTRNWGYDGVFPFAVQNSYGGPEGLKRLVDAAHRTGLAVVLDAVYNHLGPEGNHLAEFGPYFTDRYHTPWGPALNFDGAHSDEVRRFFFENALYWQTEFHVDALRLDAVHAIRDGSALPFLQELARVTHQRSEELGRRFYLIAESDRNDARLITPEVLGGYGVDAQWSDDLHHCLHVLLTGEREGYYEDFGGTKLLAKTFREGYAYTGEYSKSRKRRHGNSPRLASAKQFVVFSQNHDQIGNRMKGDRLSRLANLEALKLAAGTILLSPFIPLLFMGEEHGEPAPFQYFISHTDPYLVETVRRGRQAEFSGFAWQGKPADPQSEVTFQDCVLDHKLARAEGSHQALYSFYQELLRLRKENPAIATAEKDTLEVEGLDPEQVVHMLYNHPVAPVLIVLSFAAAPTTVSLRVPPGIWRSLLDSSACRWSGPGESVPGKFSSNGQVSLKLPPQSVVVFERT